MVFKFILKNSFLCFLFLFPLLAVKGQKETNSTPDSVDYSNRSGRLVTLNLSVWSSKKGFLTELNRNDFEIYDDKEKRDIEFFSKEAEPVSVGILFDLSGSMASNQRKKISEISSGVAGLISFINNSNPRNEYFVVGFSTDTKVLLNLTQDRKEIEKNVVNILTAKPEGNTSFFDALKVGYEKISKGKFERKILLVFSDGVDNSSEKYNFDDIKNINRMENVSLYIVNFITDPRDSNSQESLEAEVQTGKLSQNSGGRIFYAKTESEVVGAFQMLAEELKNQYTVRFSAGESKKKDEWRDLKIKFVLPKEKRKELGKILVRAANGYRLQ